MTQRASDPEALEAAKDDSISSIGEESVVPTVVLDLQKAKALTSS